MTNSEISENIQFANANGLPIRPNELVGGERSGTKILPQQPVDNPNFVNSVAQHTSVGWVWLPHGSWHGARLARRWAFLAIPLLGGNSCENDFVLR